MAVEIAFVFAAFPLASAPHPGYKVYVEEPGIYRVDFEDLKSAGFLGDHLLSADLGMTCSGDTVPIHVEDGGDGLFGAGDWIEFVGERLHGESSFFNAFSRYNVYVLSSRAEQPARMVGSKISLNSIARDAERAEYRRTQHLEEDLLRLQVATEEEDPWYWAKLVMNAEEPFTHTADLSDLAEGSPSGPAMIRIELRGLSEPESKPDSEFSDHWVDITWNGTRLASAQWNGTEPYVVTIPGIRRELLSRGSNTLTMRIPSRSGDEDSRDLVDVVLLNWIEISYPRSEKIGTGQVRLRLAEGSSYPTVEASPNRQLFAYGGGSRNIGAKLGDTSAYALSVPADEDPFIVAGPEDLYEPAAVTLDRPSRLADSSNQADYIMIAHGSLLDAIEPLARLHRSRGLTVKVVDLQDVYDEFRHGIAHPQAIRDFLIGSFRKWRQPAPKYVLLVGDASWDSRNTWTDGEDPDPTNLRDRRGLIPTWSYPLPGGRAASDNFFVAEGGFLPEMAIGRLPLVDPKEVKAVVDKIAGYISASEVGPWRQRVLLVSNEYRRFQRSSDRLARHLASQGFAAPKIYPGVGLEASPSEPERLIQAFDDGQLLVHFLGHGGRYIWRLGPPDLVGNRNVFDLEHLDRLRPGGALPVVLSFTCYSAPFDHPYADSIGEKLLRLEDRGAIAVFAASWRITPPPNWSRALIEELTRPEATIGGAVLLAKRRIGNRIFSQTFNLLGDPAVPVALPTGQIKVEASVTDGGSLRVEGIVEVSDFSGNLLVEAVDGFGDIVASVRTETKSPEFRLDLLATDQVHVVRAYAWNQERGVDATGALDLAPNAPPSFKKTKRRGQAATKTRQPNVLRQQDAVPKPASVGPFENTIRWSTASEVDTFGYAVYRGESPDSVFEKITATPIVAASASDETNSYAFVDSSIDPTKTYYYFVESISMSGVRKRFTPIAKVGPKAPR